MLEASQLRSLAEAIAAGSAGNAGIAALTSSDPSGAISHAALMHGVRLVMLYGGIGVGMLAALSLITFRIGK